MPHQVNQRTERDVGMPGDGAGLELTASPEPMDISSFRLRTLAALQAARARWPGSKLYLLYDPGFNDPLRLTGSNKPQKRDTAVFPWAANKGYGESNWPRVIELDCRRVAPYLLETDPGFDDPLLEESITLAHAALVSGVGTADAEAPADFGWYSWLVSPDSAATISHRFVGANQRIDPVEFRFKWLRWHDPRMLALLWPTMTDPQRTALLGTRLTWHAFDAARHAVEFASPTRATEQPVLHGAPVVDGPAPAPGSALSPTNPQWHAVERVAWVNHLLDAWREQRQAPLPQGATQSVYRELLRAEGWGLAGRDVQTLLLTVLEMPAGFGADPALREAVNGAVLEPGTLADRLGELPPAIWQRHASLG